MTIKVICFILKYFVFSFCILYMTFNVNNCNDEEFCHGYIII